MQKSTRTHILYSDIGYRYLTVDIYNKLFTIKTILSIFTHRVYEIVTEIARTYLNVVIL